MTHIVETDDEGDLIVPRKVLGSAKPHTRYRVEVEGNALTLRPLEHSRRFSAMASPEEWVESFLDWVNRPRPPAPILPDEALGREHIYD